MAVAPPKITVSRAEYMREISSIGAKVRRKRKLWSEWGRSLSLWRYYRRLEDLERARKAIRDVWAVIREERAERALLAKKVWMPYWRVGIAYMFRERVPKPPYYFYAEFRITVYTRHPEKWAKWDPVKMMYTDPHPEFEAELRELLFIASVLAGRKHWEWLRAVLEIPGPTGRIPDFECTPCDEKEVEEPLDSKHYYVRIEEPRKAVEYDNKNRYDLEAGRRVATIPGAGVESWLRAYRRLLAEGVRTGRIRRPERWEEAAKYRTLDEWRELGEAM